MSPELMHFAEAPVTLDRTRRYVQSTPREFAKPRGLWVSATGEMDWPTWCRSEGFAVHTLACAHRVVLAAGASVARICDCRGLHAFHDEFSADDEGLHWSPDHESRYRSLDWAAVAQRYDALVIAPYLWECRYDGPFWYYGFDCASGCVWNLDAIAEFEFLPAYEHGSEVRV